MKLLPWLLLLRIVNLPTVPGDVMAGAAAALVGGAAATDGFAGRLVCAVAAVCSLYLYGLVDNDIVGAKTDSDRPIPNGEISLGAARLCRSLLFGLSLVSVYGAFHFGAHPAIWALSAALLASIVVYNRFKFSLAMGLCRGLGTLFGTAAVLEKGSHPSFSIFHFPFFIFLLWSLYIAAVTRYSEGEEHSPAKRAMVGFLIGAIVYLQLLALIAAELLHPEIPALGNLLVLGALLLIILRIVKKILPKVSAS